MLELGYDKTQLDAMTGDASQWDNQSLAPYDSTPTVGSIAQTDNGAQGGGHVAVVESVNSDGTITVSESAYTTSRTSPWNVLWRHRTVAPTWFQRFIHVAKAHSSSTFTFTLPRGLDLISFPIAPTANGSSTFAAVFAQLGTDFLPWVFYLDDSGAPVLASASSLTIEPKRGYFIYMAAARQIAVYGDAVAPTVQIHRGLSVIGVATASHLSNTNVVDTAYSVQGGSLAQISMSHDFLEPGLGYFVYAASDLSLSAAPGTIAATMRDVPEQRPITAATIPDFSSMLRIDQTGASEVALTFGLRFDATDGFDSGIDQVADFPLPGSIYAYFDDGGFPLKVNYKSASETKSWPFIVYSQSRGFNDTSDNVNPVVLSWAITSSGSLDPSARVELLDAQGSVVADMRSSTSYSFAVSAASTRRNFSIRLTIPVSFTLTVTAGAGGSVTKSPDQQSYTAGSGVTVTATPDRGYNFTGWTGDVPSGQTTTNPLFITMDGGKTLQATFSTTPPVMYALTVTAGPGGTVAKSPDQPSYSAGSTVTVTATPDHGYNFAGWTGDMPSGETTTNPLSITMDRSKTLHATFSTTPPVTYTLTLTAGAGGSVTKSPDQQSYTAGSGVTVTATPDRGYNFTGWTGDVPSGQTTTNPLFITMDGGKTLQATFSTTPPVMYALTVTAGPGGTVAKSPDQPSYSAGTTVTVTATPDHGYHFTGWTGNVPTSQTTANPLSVTMDGDRTLQATFSTTPPETCYSLTVLATPPEGGTASTTTAATCNGGYSRETKITLSATPNPEYDFQQWSAVNCTVDRPTQALTTCTITGGGDAVVTAAFSKRSVPCNSFTASVSPPNGGSVVIGTDPNCTGGYTTDTAVQVTASVNGDYQFEGWTAHNCTVADATDPQTTCTITGGDAAVIATFSHSAPSCVPFTTVAKPPDAGVVVTRTPETCTGGYTKATSVLISAAGIGLYRFSSWTAMNCTLADANASTTTCTPDGAGNVVVVARFTAPMSQQGTALVASDSVGPAQAGESVAVSADGNTAVIGAPGDSTALGAAYVWIRAAGVWSQQGPKLVASDAAGTSPWGLSQQGNSVGISADGDTVIVGGRNDGAGTGAAWIWRRSAGRWTQDGPKLVGSGAITPLYGASQGISVGLSGDGNTAIVGGWNDDSQTGAAWMWTRTNGTWTQQAKLVGADGDHASQGTSVALSFDGNTAIIGGAFDNIAEGAAWIWTRSGGTWTQDGPKLVASDTGSNAPRQGWSVALSADGKTAIVGGPEDYFGAGAAWVWTRRSGGWTRQGVKLVGTGAVGGAQQGSSVSLSADGNIALVGGPHDRAVQPAAGGAVQSVGAAWIWTREADAWTQQGQKRVATGATGNPSQGSSVAISGDGNTAIIGGPFNGTTVSPSGGIEGVGAAWILSAPTPSQPHHHAAAR